MDLPEQLKVDQSTGVRRLVSDYGNRLFETALHLCGNAADAEDYAFRTLEHAILKIESFRASSSFFTWLYAILVNLMRSDARRKAANALDFPGDIPEQIDPRPQPSDEMSAQEEAAAIRDSLDRLPYVLREVIVFRYWEDLTVPEIAKVLKIPEGTVKSRLFQAKNLMRLIVSRTIEAEHSSN